MIAKPHPEIPDIIFEDAHEISLNQGDVLTEQFAKVDYFYFLLEGKISFFLKVDEGAEELLVGSSSEPMTPIGWSGLISPNRYATTAKVVSENAKLICWEFGVLEGKLENNDLSIEMVRLICKRCAYIIRESISMLSLNTPHYDHDQSLLSVEDYQNTRLPEEQGIVQFLRKSPFFEIFEEEQLEFVARHLERRQYHTNDVIYEQGTVMDGIYLLVSGKVSFSYKNGEEQPEPFRNMSSTGFMVGWTASIGIATLISATARQESILYFIPTEAINVIGAHDKLFAREFHYRLLWLIGNQLQAIRARFISSTFNHEIIAVSNLIEQNSTSLDLLSPLHKVPHLLKNKHTIDNGIEILKDLKGEGSSLERNIAAHCLDTMSAVKKELAFYKGLVNVYQKVVHSPPSLKPPEIRKICAESFLSVFDHTSIKVDGWQNLPEESGHIFIYNHLRNHPFNTLPNNFQITLDSHFISSNILYKKYGDPGVRIVRIGRGGEYAHQDYYQRLGHIDVYTKESDPKSDTKEHRDQKRQAFFDLASGYISNKTNLLISPEGTSYTTEESPGEFKSGAFRLALSMRPEPYIIPISIANFDKRVRKNTFAVVINTPFKISEYINNPEDKQEMKDFLTRFQKVFSGYVDNAINLGGARKVLEHGRRGIDE